VEGLVRVGRVAVDGVPVDDPAARVAPGASVTLDGEELYAPAGAGVLLHKPAGEPVVLAHPPGLVPALPLAPERGGAELLLADRRLAERLADPRFPQPEAVDRTGRRTRVAGIDLGELEPGAWRPLSPAELRSLRLSVRLPPR
jgi:16S rRNA U516 pseudouridylate synthase RsuA-like enzyme